MFATKRRTSHLALKALFSSHLHFWTQAVGAAPYLGHAGLWHRKRTMVEQSDGP